MRLVDKGLLIFCKKLGPCRYRAPELLFRPDLVGDESEGIVEILANSIQKSDMDLRKTLYQNIVLSGGSTLFKGFGDRLLNDLKRMVFISFNMKECKI